MKRAFFMCFCMAGYESRAGEYSVLNYSLFSARRLWNHESVIGCKLVFSAISISSISSSHTELKLIKLCAYFCYSKRNRKNCQTENKD